MAAINGTVKWGQVPLWYSGSEMQQQQYSYGGNYLVSANMPMIYQIIWTSTGVNEMYEPTASGDIVNVVFKIYGTTEYPAPVALVDWDLIGQVKKTRDIPNTDLVTSSIANDQRFTIDVARMVADQLSYSLVPIGKGSWQNQTWGGMNGGMRKQDNVTENISPYNVTRNGAYRRIRVDADFEILNSNGLIELSTTNISASNSIFVINSAPSFKSKTYYNQVFTLQKWTVADSSQKRAMSNCPNFSVYLADKPAYQKPISITDEAEFLYFFVRESFNGSDPTDYYNRYEVYGESYNASDTLQQAFVLGSEWKNSGGTTHICSDISHNFDLHTSTSFTHTQNQLAVQNVAPAYINSHAYASTDINYPYTSAVTPINSNTAYYKLYVRGFYNANNPSPNLWVSVRHSNVYYYYLNDTGDTKSSYENVRFHWLNTAGGIDSYTARRDVLESISVQKSLMEKSLPNRRFIQDDKDGSGADLANSAYYSDTMRGLDTYQGGKEVLSVDATTNNKVYTEPLNKVEATWLREMFYSPNVWVEYEAADSDEWNYKQNAASQMNDYNPYLRPSSKIYMPVIITNNEIVSLDQAQGLVSYNIEYTLSQGIVTQRN
tara:strand:- start:1000 stop:2811 length:1812 start_codon:yes stop_codon:yes gene_type:complete